MLFPHFLCITFCHCVGKVSVQEAKLQWVQPNRERVRATSTCERGGKWKFSEALAPLKKQRLAGKSLLWDPKPHTCRQKELLALTGHCIPELIAESCGIVVSTRHKGKLSKGLGEGGHKGSWDLSTSLLHSITSKAISEILPEIVIVASLPFCDAWNSTIRPSVNGKPR